MPPLSKPQSQRALLVAFAAVTCDYVAVGMMRTVMPFYAKRLSLAAAGEAGALSSNFMVGALEATYGVGQVIGACTLGTLSDR
jgi:hypothetical protein